jgi:hypothetical protein
MGDYNLGFVFICYVKKLTQVNVVKEYLLPKTTNSKTLIVSTSASSNTIVSGNVIVQNNSALIIPTGVILDINFSSFNLFIESGSFILIKMNEKII